MVNSIGNSLHYAVQGLKKTSAEVADSAFKIVNADTLDVNTDSEMINMMAASQSYKANATVISMTKRMEDALGQIFDERA
jgi:flagellar hook-associated protein FlgK